MFPEKIEKNFGQIISGFKKINTDIYTSQDRHEEIENRRKRIEVCKAKQKLS